jgi:filamentous hemagglutinin
VTLTGAATSTGDLRLKTTGAATLASLSAGGDLLVDAVADVTTGALAAGGDIALRSSTGGLALGQATAGGSLVLRAAGDLRASGSLTAQGGAGGAAALLYAADPTTLAGALTFAAGGVDARAGGAIAVAGAVRAAGDVRLQTAAGGPVSAGAIGAGGDILLDGAGVSAGDLTAGGDVAVRGRNGGTVTLGATSAGDDIVVRTSGAMRAAGALRAGGGADRSGAGDRLASAEGSIVFGGQSLDLSAAAIDLKAGSLSLAGLSASGDIHLQAAGAAALAGASAGRDLLIDATGPVTAGQLAAGRDLAVRSTQGGLATGAASAGDDLVLRAAGDIRTGALAAGGGADTAGVGDLLFSSDPTRLAGDFDLAGASIDLRAAGGAIAVSGPVNARGDARFQTAANGAVQVAAVSAGRDILLDGGTIVGGALAAGGDVAVQARGGAVQLASASAGDDLVIRAAQGVTVAGGLSAQGGADASGAGDRLLAAAGAISAVADPATGGAAAAFDLAGANIDVRAGGDVRVGGASASSGAARFETPGALSLAGLTATQEIFTRSGGLLINGDWAASNVRIEATADAGVALGDGAAAPAGAFVLSSAALGRISADRVQIFAGDTASSQRGAALIVGTLGVDTTKVRSALELYAGGQADVTITGGLAPVAGGVSGTLLRIGAPNALVGDWTPRSIRIIADNGGAIGAATTGDGMSFSGVRAFGAVELNAVDSILAGYQTFVDKLALAQAGDVPGLVKTLPAPARAGGPPVLIAAGSLTLRAGKIAQQDTSSALGVTRTGIYVADGPLQIGGAAAGAGPDFVELYGAIGDGASVLTGASASLSSQIHLVDGTTPQQSYRLNTCVILQQAACTPNAGMPDLGVGALRTAALQVLDRQDAGAIEDPTVASATNEEIWRDPQ